MMTKHPFVATPNKGTCSSCGRKKSDTVHDWEKEDIESLQRASIGNSDPAERAEISRKIAQLEVEAEEQKAREWEARHPGRSNDPRDEYVGRVPNSWLRNKE